MEKQQFKAESKRLLDLMINSIYTHKEIFLRELISNASDATDKLYYNALQDGNTGLDRDALSIEIKPDAQARTLTITDHGCGMTREELENNLGTIAQSGSLAFKQQHDAQEDIDIIGQFGVGFYSAFMVSKHVQVCTRSEGDGQAWCWESDGADGFTITPCEKADVGSTITLTLKDNSDEENYDEFLDTWHLQELVRKYSDYIRYPIRMDVTRSRKKEGTENEYEDYTVTETLNSMVPIWKKSKDQVTDEEYNQFYKEKFFDFEDPLRIIHSSTEGTATYNALLFVPSRPPYNYYSKDFEKGLQLYASGVLIMDRCSDLLPDYFSFVRGLVDSQDLSLNISREMLQHDRQLKLIASSLEKKIKNELTSMLKNDRETYEKFFRSFGLQLKFGVYSNYGVKKDLLQDLLLFASSHGDGLTTLQEYVDRMPEGQKAIYYACGSSAAQIGSLPQIELLRDKGYEVLYLTDDVDEFALKVMNTYKEKPFQSAADGDLGLESEEEKKEAENQTQQHQELLDCMKQALEDKVTAVRLSTRLKSHPVCLSAQGEISLEMEKVLGAMPGNNAPVKAQRVLELNPSHPLFHTLCDLYEKDREKLKTYASILYNQAMLIEGFPIEDPVAYSNAVYSLMGE
ncbi:MAG: molecular chaperone HtpG [Eubacteriales bacterium]|jgi:molecular chaperone HtpG